MPIWNSAYNSCFDRWSHKVLSGYAGNGDKTGMRRAYADARRRYYNQGAWDAVEIWLFSFGDCFP